MRDLIVTQNITVDGVVEAGHWFDAGGGGSDLLDVLNEQASRADAFLTGRLTFEAMRGFWPQQTDDTTGVTAYLNQVHKYVVSTTLQEPGWEPTTILRELDDVRRLKTTTGRDIVCTGSISLAHAVIAAGLVDEYRLFVYPTVVTTGRRLFPDGIPQSLRLTEVKSFESGIVLLTYRPLPEG
ncbi:dihydrofolate reductase family protein [Kribbella sp. NPDC023972]|uniref:dihydrofolate reductase family protein n=1 Tax=Kribbella sp. NPDC023972 TaxID=3154795 RepID=UPI0033E39BC6